MLLANKNKTIILWDAGITQDIDILEGNNVRVAVKIPPVAQNMFMPGKAQNVNLEINIPAKH